jgi:predicted DNA-binding transcriptional regulator AlpA
MKRKLIGMQEISAYARRTEATIMDWILKEGFPQKRRTASG